MNKAPPNFQLFDGAKVLLLFELRKEKLWDFYISNMLIISELCFSICGIFSLLLF